MNRKPFSYLKTNPELAGLLTILFTVSVYADTIRPGVRGECTVGLFGADVTADGRPILWKNRDVGDFDQRYIYYESYQRDGITTLPFIGDIYRSDTTGVYMGANSAGFAIMNSDSANLNDSLSGDYIMDGTIMRLALETCSTLSDFEAILDSTDRIGRRDCWNFGVIDAYGGCAFYECSNYSYIRFDVDSPENPDGFLIRANYSMSGGDYHAGDDRYERARSLTADRLAEKSIDPEFVLGTIARDLCNQYDNPYPLPYNGFQLGAPAGYIYCVASTISRKMTTSTIVIRGVAPGEDPSLTTIFAVLGPPTLSLAYPLWVGSGEVPDCLTNPDAAPMYLYCQDRKRLIYDNPEFQLHLNSAALLDNFGQGIYTYTLPIERWGIGQADESVARWAETSATADEFSREQNRIAEVIYAGFQYQTADYLPPAQQPPIGLPAEFTLFNYPNPFNGSTTIMFEYANLDGPVSIRIFDSLGRLVRQIDGTNDNDNFVVWHGDDQSGRQVSTGVYYYALVGGRNLSKANKMVVLK